MSKSLKLIKTFYAIKILLHTYFKWTLKYEFVGYFELRYAQCACVHILIFS